MNNKHLSNGVFLLSIGVIWALVNVGIIEWSVLTSILTLWPLLIVMAGINIIFKNSEWIKSLGWIVFLSIVVIYGQSYSERFENVSPRAGEQVVIEKLAETKNAELRLDLGGVKLGVNSGATNLLEAVITDPNTRHTVEFKNGNETAEIRFQRGKSFNVRFEEVCNLSLNKDVKWDMIDLNVGAISGTVDMSQLKVKKVDLDVGAGDLELLMGNQMEIAEVKIDAGASKIKVVVPKDAGVSVKFDGGLNSTNFEELGWQKQSGNVYLSPNYDASKAKIKMDVDMGVGKFEVIPQ